MREINSARIMLLYPIRFVRKQETKENEKNGILYNSIDPSTSFYYYPLNTASVVATLLRVLLRGGGIIVIIINPSRFSLHLYLFRFLYYRGARAF